MLLFLAMLFPALLLGCVTIETSSRKAPSADLAQYHTFDFAPTSQPSDTRFLTPTNEARVKAAIRSELAQRGLRQDQPADLQFRLFLETRTRNYDRANPSSGSGSMGSDLRKYYGLLYDASWGTQSTITYPEGTLVVQAVDLKQNRKVWEGVATSALHQGLPPEKLEQRIHEAVAGMFKHFPKY